MAPKPEIITSLELYSHAKLGIFDDVEVDRGLATTMIATTTDCQKLRDWRANRPYCNFRLSAVIAIAQG